MHAHEIQQASKSLATRLANEMKRLRVTRADIETVRALVAGFHCGNGAPLSVQQIEDLENATLRKFVELCA